MRSAMSTLNNITVPKYIFGHQACHRTCKQHQTRLIPAHLVNKHIITFQYLLMMRQMASDSGLLLR
ncbi:hypothetical protein J8273_6933 [Carpediemonas membranifera]|uniref:Uncharacterized protein n=1 Tax=Carpediemonas membranifera TaxID=201153 RepID=A0A8J6ARV5_9EUKA|nr:hypothetical protein J8273_6933 [Carpediemonas membranifera]|eukprot:KAG9390695.1 hypothetical protein J8273_6933 [Carpediemonas membranifera]